MRKILITVVATLMVWFAPKEIRADEMTISAQPILPTEQVTDTTGYFDLQLLPGATKTVYIKVFNHVNQSQRVTITNVRATTNQNGVVDYENRRDQAAWRRTVSAPKTVDVPASGETVIPVTIQMPEAPVVGKLAGGITLSTQTDVASNGTVKHEFATTIAVILQNSVAPVPADLRVLGAGYAGKQHAWILKMANDMPDFHYKGSLKVKIKQGQKVIQTVDHAQLQFAPSDKFKIAVPVVANQVKPGKYSMVGEIQTDKGKWKIDETFEVTNEQTHAGVASASVGVNWLLIALLVLPLFLLILLIWVWRRMRQLKKVR
jgi:hypothetical protein